MSNITHGYAGSSYQPNAGGNAFEAAHLVAEAAEKVLESNGTIAAIRQQMGGHAEEVSSLRKDVEALAQRVVPTMFEHAEQIESFKPTRASTEDLALRMARIEEQVQGNRQSIGEERRRLDEECHLRSLQYEQVWRWLPPPPSRRA
eukprot:COSAG05_NODE_612_length_8357_cov_40.832647_8_plen_146_part_00